MNVSGIRPISGFSRITNINIVDSKKDINLSVDAVNNKVNNNSNNAIDNKDSNAVSRDTTNQTFTSKDMAKQYDKRKSYDLKGKDSDLSTLDVEKAISDIQKNNLMEQYKSFVYDDKEDIARGNRIRETENFVL